jgi:cell wall-associated NlpC family hydrolase
MTGEDIIERARRLIGVRFRPQGRNAENGLDCIGLASLAYRVGGPHIRDDYRLAGSHNAVPLKRGLAVDFRRVPKTQIRTGDLLLCRPSAMQWHLGVYSGAGVIHADARIGRVVETPGALPWPIAAVYRRRTRRR